MTEDKNQNFNVFAYGSLMDQRFVERLIGRAIKTMPAKLEGYKKLKLPNRKYPFAIKP
jgi:cation transport regulator ChaC